MILLLDTSTGLCRLTFVNGGTSHDYEWQADRELARGLLAFIRDKLVLHDKTFDDISGIGVYQGPGSFTGLRIGLAVCNTIADANSTPIVGETGSDWQARARQRLSSGENDRIILPLYGSEARITQPRK